MVEDKDSSPREVALNLARELRAKFYPHCFGNRQPTVLNTTKFAKYIGEEYGVKITAVLSAELGTHLRGMLLRKPSEATILVADSNNECWRRFVYVKEICHIFIDDEDEFTEDAEGLAIDLVHEGGENHQPSLAYRSELIATYAAIDIMIPPHLEQWMAHKANVEGQTPYQIAFALKVPKKYVEHRIRAWDGIKLNSEESS